MSHFVVIGAGQAGASLVAKLRSSGFEGEVTLIGAEPVPPYQRPPLSKKYLLGEMEEARLYLRPADFYETAGIRLMTGTRVVEIDPAEHRILLQGDEPLAYDRLALCTGAEPRQLPSAVGGDLDGVLTMRDLADADRMAPLMVEGAHVLVIGGGYIGLEAAAVAAKRGLRVTVVEAAQRILGRVASEETADFFRDLHRSHGVEVIENVGLERLEGEDAVERAVLADGRVLEIDFAITGIGIVPNTILAESAGLAVENGIRVDELCRTSEADIFAAGDCASFPWAGERIRLESVGNAIDMGEAAALAMMGGEEAYAAKPWFWSDQYECKLQIAGLNRGYDRVVVRDGGAARSHWYYCGGRLIAVDAMNDPRGYMIGKRLIEAGKSPDPEVVGDAGSDLKALMTA
ncbi:NAD(P)/FAD-dependent oxidoreductase [Pseudoroseicyclus tamaricis]|uniref:FAD-dependent oxidoreductase n=1 Tax=Pseudoroseicyclus tamaricis TaxID=2705421 RepID=A0A6B2K7B8_9RHOB|nr:FAD-dependent oxidoreductase [Pseudoroseicyclus tamaricis]NDV02876.1 FAD-dependent oxidoreductase [Pseudoroseicyclus tamaricis]